jgi:hypothetical protein
MDIDDICGGCSKHPCICSGTFGKSLNEQLASKDEEIIKVIMETRHEDMKLITDELCMGDSEYFKGVYDGMIKAIRIINRRYEDAGK